MQTTVKDKSPIKIVTWNVRTMLQKENIRQGMERVKIGIIGRAEVR